MPLHIASAGGWELNTGWHKDSYASSLATQTFIKKKFLSNFNLVHLTIHKRHATTHQVTQMHEHFDVKKSCTNPEAKCSKNSAKCISVLSGFSSPTPLQLTNISASLLFSKKMHNSLGRNLAFQAVLKLLLMSLRRGGMIPEFAILHAVLGAFL